MGNSMSVKPTVEKSCKWRSPLQSIESSEFIEVVQIDNQKICMTDSRTVRREGNRDSDSFEARKFFSRIVGALHDDIGEPRGRYHKLFAGRAAFL